MADPMDPNDNSANAGGRFLEAFGPFQHAAAQASQPAWILPLRQAGLARFADHGFPTLRHEDWRFTNLAPLAALPFRPTLDAQTDRVSPTDVARLPLAGMTERLLVFIDGHYAPGLSRPWASTAQVRVRSLSETLRADGAWLDGKMAQVLVGQDAAFRALNDAYFTDGVVVQVRAGASVSEPIHALYVSTGDEAGRASHPRNLVVAESNSQVTVLEQYVSLGAAPTLTNVVTQLVAGEGARVEHVRFQDEGQEAFHLGAVRATVAGSANLAVHSFALGARLSRQSLGVMLDGPGLEAVLNGLYLVSGSRLADHHMVVDHAQPQGASHEYFNGILSDRARGVFHGRILVRPGAQKTDAKQTNKNLLLSDGAVVHTKPQLEIYADDVRCTHGATIGQLNPESVFYLRARGLPIDMARRMLIHAFAGEIIDRVGCERDSAGVRISLVWARLEADEHVHV